MIKLIAHSSVYLLLNSVYEVYCLGVFIIGQLVCVSSFRYSDKIMLLFFLSITSKKHVWPMCLVSLV